MFGEQKKSPTNITKFTNDLHS